MRKPLDGYVCTVDIKSVDIWESSDFTDQKENYPRMIERDVILKDVIELISEIESLIDIGEQHSCEGYIKDFKKKYDIR